MATGLALKQGSTGVAAATLLNKLSNPARSVSAIPCLQRSFSSASSQMTAYDDDDNHAGDVARRSDSSVSRRRDHDLFSDLLDPFAPSRSLSQMLNIMDQLSMSSRGGVLGTRRGWDAKEDKESLTFRFDMPGVDREKFKVSVEQNSLVIRAEEDEEPPRRYSSRIDLPPDVYKYDGIKAEVKNGVLKVRVPKVKEEERKDVMQIEVA